MGGAGWSLLRIISKKPITTTETHHLTMVVFAASIVNLKNIYTFKNVMLCCKALALFFIPVVESLFLNNCTELDFNGVNKTDIY